MTSEAKLNLPVFDQISLGHIDGLPESIFPQLGIDQSNILTVGSGDTEPVRPDTDVVWSDGFKHCAGLILRDSMQGSFQFTHSWSRDEPALRRMRADPPAEALLIYGTESEPQYDIELFLGANGILRKTQTDTGRQPYGILFNARNGLVSVVRRAPTASVVSYRAFNIQTTTP